MSRTSCPLPMRSLAMKSPTAPAPAIPTRISAPVPARGAPAARRASRRPTTKRSTSPSWPIAFVSTTSRGAEPCDGRQPEAPRLVEGRELLAAPGGRDPVLDEDDLPARVHPVVGLLFGWEQAAQHLVGRPADGRDRRDAEPLVDQRTPGVVDAGDDALDAEVLAGDAGREDVGVVTARDRGDGFGSLDAGSRRGRRGRSRTRRLACR